MTSTDSATTEQHATGTGQSSDGRKQMEKKDGQIAQGHDPNNLATFTNCSRILQFAMHRFHAALELAGIENFTWHDLRHTFVRG